MSTKNSDPGRERDPDRERESIDQLMLRIVQESLIPMQEDIALWINDVFKDQSCLELLGNELLSAENLFEKLSDGRILCVLGNLIRSKIEIDNEKSSKTNPIVYNKKPKPFYAKMENQANFLKFCSEIGVNQVVRYESRYLVNHNDANTTITEKRLILICLLDLARKISKKI